MSDVKKTLQGKSVVIRDIRDDDALCVFVKRSTISRGRVLRVVLPDLPAGVFAVKAEDVPGKNSVTVDGVDVRVLASDEIRYFGEPILLLAGRDEEELEALAEDVVVEYEQEEPYLSFEMPREDRVARSREIERGRPDAAFKEAEKVVSAEVSTGIQEHFYSEPHAAYAAWENEVSTLRVTCSTQWPHHVHRTIADVLAIPSEIVAVVVPEEPDLALDGKLWYPSLIAAHAALVAWVTKKNVKLAPGREEDFLYSPKRAPVDFKLRAGLDREGRILVLEAAILVNMGAYPIFAGEILDRTVLGVLGGYSCPNLRIRALALVTDLPPLGPFSGMGEAAGLFAAETFSEKLREAAEIPPLAWKSKNLISKDRPGIFGEPSKHFIPDPAILERASAISDFSRKNAVFELAKKRRTADLPAVEAPRGIGLALGFQGSCFLGGREFGENAGVTLRLDTEGRVRLSAAAVPGSRSLHEIWKRIVGESLGVPEVRIDPVDTMESGDLGPSTLSRNITQTTKLIEDCCQLIKKKRFRSPLPLSASKTLHVPRNPSWDEKSFIGDPFFAMAWAAAVVEVRFDVLGSVHAITGIWIVADGGSILDAAEARRTIERGIGQALGWTFLEKVSFEDGRIPESQAASYRIPSTQDVPTPVVEFIGSGGKKPVKGIGDLALSCVPAAYAAALYQATGSLPSRIPIPFDFASRGEEGKP